MSYQKKGYQKKLPQSIEIFVNRYSELRKQMSIKKEQYKFFDDQMNVSNNNGKDYVKSDDGEIGKVNYRYIDDK